jgi:hypothetical protein
MSSKPRTYCSGSLWWLTEGPDKFHLFGPLQSFGKVTDRAARRRPVSDSEHGFELKLIQRTQSAYSGSRLLFRAIPSSKQRRAPAAPL